jgi:hypothetical protein
LKSEHGEIRAYHKLAMVMMMALDLFYREKGKQKLIFVFQWKGKEWW